MFDLWVKYPELYKELQQVEEYIKKHAVSRNSLLSETVGELVDAGGKRLRPALAIISARFGSYNKKKLIPLAAALEILHMATLVHDDIIDRSDLRRGRATVSEKHGVDMAVYTGDYLLAKAVLMLSGGVPAKNLELLAKTVKSICEGEVDQYQDRYKINVSVNSYLKRISRKTAVLFSAACAIGAYQSQCSLNIIRSLSRFGMFFGIAFQIKDDISDILSNETSLGKPVLSDLAKGNLTIPVIYVIKNNNQARNLINSYFNNSKERLDISRLMELVRENGGIEYSNLLKEKYVDKCFKILETLPDNDFKPVIIDLLSLLKK